MAIFDWVDNISNIYLGMPDIIDIFVGKQSMLGPSLRPVDRINTQVIY